MKVLTTTEGTVLGVRYSWHPKRGVLPPGMIFVLTVDDVAWAPPEWTCCGFPLVAPECELICLDTALATLHSLADTITESDSTALGPAMHVAHMLVARQGGDGRWPAHLNARTGEMLGEQRTDAPLRLYNRLTNLLQTTEFDHVMAFSEKRMPHQGGIAP